MKKNQHIRELAILSTLGVDERKKIGLLATKKVYRKNEFIFREGEPAEAIYLVESGRVRLFKISGVGKEITLDMVKRGDLFGENVFFEGAEYKMSAQAVEDTIIWSYKREHLPLLLQNPRILLKIIQVLGIRLNNYTEKITNIAFRDVKGRISATLLRLADEYGKPSPEGIIIDINVTHEDLANLISASRVMVTKVLSELKHEGIIATKRQKITLLSLEKLAQAAEIF